MGCQNEIYLTWTHGLGILSWSIFVVVFEVTECIHPMIILTYGTPEHNTFDKDTGFGNSIMEELYSELKLGELMR